MTEDEFLYLLSRLFVVGGDSRLEKKAWYRFIKVVHGFSIFAVILAAGLTAYMLFDSKNLATATLVCNDGTTWNAIDSNSYGTYKSELDMYHLCGLCNYRQPDNKYNVCELRTQSKILFDSYKVNRTYTKEHSILAVMWWSSLVLFGGLIVMKIIAKVIVYIFGGGKAEEDN